jgi:hypothetical protein
MASFIEIMICQPMFGLQMTSYLKNGINMASFIEMETYQPKLIGSDAKLGTKW